MRIKYNGKKIKEHKGCPVCGSRRNSGYKVLSVNTYYTPSGHRLTFRIGNEYDVTEEDGEFLMSIGDEFSVCDAT